MTSILGRVKALALSAGRHSSHLTDRMTCSLHLKAIVITIKMSEPWHGKRVFVSHIVVFCLRTVYIARKGQSNRQRQRTSPWSFFFFLSYIYYVKTMNQHARIFSLLSCVKTTHLSLTAVIKWYSIYVSRQQPDLVTHHTERCSRIRTCSSIRRSRGFPAPSDNHGTRRLSRECVTFVGFSPRDLHWRLRDCGPSGGRKFSSRCSYSARPSGLA